MSPIYCPLPAGSPDQPRCVGDSSIPPLALCHIPTHHHRGIMILSATSREVVTTYVQPVSMMMMNAAHHKPSQENQSHYYMLNGNYENTLLNTQCSYE